MKLFIDCTETYRTKLNTGIQRVVRQIIASNATGNHLEIIPLRFDGLGFLEVDPIELNSGNASVAKKTHSIVTGTPLYPIAKLTFNLFHQTKPYLLSLKNKSKYVDIRSEDIILVADIVRSKRYVKKLQNLNGNGVKIYQIAYDILPITYPQFFAQSNSKEFYSIAHLWPSYSKKIFAISHKVAKEVSKELNFSAVDYFHLGSDFTQKDAPTSETIFKKGDYFLSVGTIEPRKNHIHILKTFHKLWDNGFQKKLVFIGRMGWNLKSTLKLIEKTKEKYPNNFLWLEDLNDEGLEAYYENAQAVICASVDEGFGLPIVEALSRGKNVICSDIEVFREIGTEYCTYFDITEESDSLFKIIQGTNYKKDISDFKWLTWQESIDILIDKIVEDQK